MNEELLLDITDHGTAELTRRGETLWTSDSDPDVLDTVGTDYFEDRDAEDVLDYLESIGMLSADELEKCVISSPDTRDGDDEQDDEEDEQELET
jgi:hypothetical protein